MPKVTKQSENWDYNVALVTPPSFKQDLGEGELNISNPAKLTVRTDTGKVLGSVSGRYNFIQNRDVVDAVENELAHLGDFDKRIVAIRDGQRMIAEYTFKNVTSQTKKGDTVGFRFFVNNSFDGKTSVSFNVGALRMVCTNGMVSADKEWTASSRHNANLSVDWVKTAINNALERFNVLVNNYSRFESIKISQEEGRNILANMAMKNLLAKRVTNYIGEIWEAPTYKEDGDPAGERSLWNLFNAGTQYIRDNADKGQELALKQGKILFKTLLGASVGGNIKKWTMPVPNLDMPEVEEVQVAAEVAATA